MLLGLLAAMALAATAGPAAAGPSYDPSSDPYSMASLTAQIGASDWWNAGYTGAGVDVAVIDTGVAPVPALAGRVVNGPDLSLESQNPSLTHLDTNGHGTFMAGLIAGHDPTLTAPYSQAPASAYRGVAPDARIVSLKVGVADGGVDVSQVIAAIDWVVQHAHDPGFNIRVINLSYGTNSTQDYSVDPLAYAVEQAWKQGIVVVAAAGNSGYQKGAGATGLADPAYDPYVLAVGAADTKGTSSQSDDTISYFSAASSGCGGCRNPDFVAPGAHLEGLRDVNSYIDMNHPEGALNNSYFRGSGTSEATAITSGAVALVLQRYPNLTPDQVKNYLETSAFKLSSVNTTAQGAGEISLSSILNVKPKTTYTQKALTSSTGNGSLELSRGQDHLSLNGVVLNGEQDIFGRKFNAKQIASGEATASSWNGGSWNGSTWTGASWNGSTWNGATWSGASWNGASWSSLSWGSATWNGSTWNGSTWNGASWSGSTWNGGSWASGSWG